MTPAASLLQISDENAELLASLEKHLAMVEEQLESIIRKASRLPVEQQDEYWALAKDLQKEIRLTRQRLSYTEGLLPRNKGRSGSHFGGKAVKQELAISA